MHILIKHIFLIRLVIAKYLTNFLANFTPKWNPCQIKKIKIPLKCSREPMSCVRWNFMCHKSLYSIILRSNSKKQSTSSMVLYM